MFKYIVKRILISIIILIGVSIIIYTMVRLMPNDYVDLKYSQQLQAGTVTQEDIARFKELYGIGDSSFEGIMGGYFKWLGNMCKGDLGVSFKYEKPVGQVISENMWISFAIAFIATILQFLIAIPLATTSLRFLRWWVFHCRRTSLRLSQSRFSPSTSEFCLLTDLSTQVWTMRIILQVKWQNSAICCNI